MLLAWIDTYAQTKTTKSDCTDVEKLNEECLDMKKQSILFKNFLYY